MTRRRYSSDFIGTLLAEARRRERPLAAILEDHGVPERTYHNWRLRYLAVYGDAAQIVHRLERELRQLRRERDRLLRELSLQREMLGKPWRRWPPGEPPSATRSEKPG